MQSSRLALLLLSALLGSALRAAVLKADQLALITQRGQDLVQRIRVEDACRAHLERSGMKTQALPSPLLSLEKDRWTAWFLGAPGADGKPSILKVLSCPAGKLEALQDGAAAVWPAALEAQAQLMGGVLRQLGAQAGEAYLVTVPEKRGASLYRMPRRTPAGIVQVGQDFRISYRPGEPEPYRFTRFHQAIWALAGSEIPEGKGKAAGWYHNHLDSADPCETDVAAAILNGSLTLGVFGKDALYVCGLDGTITPEPRPQQGPPAEGRGGEAEAESGSGLRAFSYDQSALGLENQWLIMPGREKGSFTYACVYLDQEAGFTSEISGEFTLDAQGMAKPSGGEIGKKFGLKIRMQGDFMAARMPEGILKDLKLETPPGFLKFYQPKAETPETRLQRGFHLNHIGACERALAVLEPLQKADPGQKGLAFELAYAYNALRRPEKALPVLEAAARRLPEDPLIARELGYTNLILGRFQEAIQIYQQSLPKVPMENPGERAEQAFHLAEAYDGLKDAANRDAWLAKAKAWAPKDSALAEYLERKEK